MNRRTFVALALGSAGWSLNAAAQQRRGPVIGFIHLTSQELTPEYLAAFHQGLGEKGYVDGQNVSVEYRWAQGHNDRMPTLIADLVSRQVSAIVVLESTLGALAAKSATDSIPIIFMQGADPVRIGLVKSLSHPGSNLTGINLFLAEVAAKRLQLLHEILPGAKTIGYLRNPTNPVYAESETREVEAAARTLGIELIWMNASSVADVEAAFSNLAGSMIQAVFVSSDGFLLSHSAQVVALASRHSVPATYGWRQAVTMGGLMSYGTYFPDAWREAGTYTGRVLKGEKPAEMPVQQVTKVELLINLETAKALNLTIPPSVLGRADKVIE